MVSQFVSHDKDGVLEKLSISSLETTKKQWVKLPSDFIVIDKEAKDRQYARAYPQTSQPPKRTTTLISLAALTVKVINCFLFK